MSKTLFTEVGVYHPFPQFTWAFNLLSDEDDNWVVLTDTNYPPYVPGNQEGYGRTTQRIYITDPQLDRDEAYLGCYIENPEGNSVTTDGRAEVFIGDIEWVQHLDATTHIISPSP